MDRGDWPVWLLVAVLLFGPPMAICLMVVALVRMAP